MTIIIRETPGMNCQRLCCALSVMRTHEERVFIKKALFFVECKGKIFFS